MGNAPWSLPQWTSAIFAPSLLAAMRLRAWRSTTGTCWGRESAATIMPRGRGALRKYSRHRAKGGWGSTVAVASMGWEQHEGDRIRRRSVSPSVPPAPLSPSASPLAGDGVPRLQIQTSASPSLQSPDSLTAYSRAAPRPSMGWDRGWIRIHTFSF